MDLSENHAVEEYVPEFKNPTVTALANMTPHEIRSLSGQPCDCKDCFVKAVTQFEQPKPMLSHAQVKERCDRLYGFASYYIDYVARMDHRWETNVKDTWRRWLMETRTRIANKTLRMDEAMILYAINPDFEKDIKDIAVKQLGEVAPLSPRAIIRVVSPAPYQNLTSPPSSP